MSNELKLINKVAKKVKKNLNIEPHPNLILLVKVDRDMTSGGIYLPEGADDDTPVGEVIATGSNITHYQKGDLVYLHPPYMQFAKIERQAVIMTYEDGIIGKITRTSKEEKE